MHARTLCTSSKEVQTQRRWWRLSEKPFYPYIPRRHIVCIHSGSDRVVSYHITRVIFPIDCYIRNEVLSYDLYHREFGCQHRIEHLVGEFVQVIGVRRKDSPRYLWRVNIPIRCGDKQHTVGSQYPTQFSNGRLLLCFGEVLEHLETGHHIECSIPEWEMRRIALHKCRALITVVSDRFKDNRRIEVNADHRPPPCGGEEQGAVSITATDIQHALPRHVRSDIHIADEVLAKQYLMRGVTWIETLSRCHSLDPHPSQL